MRIDARLLATSANFSRAATIHVAFGSIAALFTSRVVSLSPRFFRIAGTTMAVAHAIFQNSSAATRAALSAAMALFADRRDIATIYAADAIFAANYFCHCAEMTLYDSRACHHWF